jgi:predicted permease
MKYRRLFRLPTRSPKDIEREIDDEFTFHVQMRAEALEKEGLSAEAARARAAREFGATATAKRRLTVTDASSERRRYATRAAAEFRQDVAYAARLLTRSPGFSLVAIVTLAVAIGGNTAVFSIVNTVLLKPPAVASPDEVVRIRAGESRMAPVTFEELQRRVGSAVEITASSTDVVLLGEPGTGTRLMGNRVAANYFSLLGVRAVIGRILLPSDTSTDLVVLSERMWRVHFASDPSIVGRRVLLDGRLHEVIGVMPRGFNGLAPPGWVREFWTPLDAARQRRDITPAFEVIGRLEPGMTISQADASLRTALAQIRRDIPALPESIVQVRVDPISGPSALRGLGALGPVFVFLGLAALIAALILVIGCANLAGLLLGRAVARRQELAVRAALGAGRGRLIRQLLTESLLLAAVGGAAGVLLAVWLTGLVPYALAQLPFPLEFDLSLDWRVLTYALVLSIATAVAFGLAPARRAARADLVAALRDGAPEGRRQRLRQALVVAQVGVCAVLLVWGLMFARSLGNVASVHPGFDPAGVLLADISFEDDREIPREDRERRIRELQTRVADLPFVQSVGGAWAVPLALSAQESFPILLDGEQAASRGHQVMANRLSPGWFRTLRIPLIAGRDFTWEDRPGRPPVAIVNQTAARRFWNGQALGRRLKYAGRRDTFYEVEIVGVAADSKYWTLGEEIEPAIYLPFQQGEGSGVTLHARTSNPREAAQRIAQELQRLAPKAYADFKPMDEATAVAVMPARIGAVVTSAFAAMAILLSTMGVYGLVAFSVAQRTREIGIRRAVGATSLEIMRLVVGGTLRLVLLGLCGGLLLGILGAGALGSLMVGVSSSDPWVIGAATLLILAAALVSSVLPALRASRVEALIALRGE